MSGAENLSRVQLVTGAVLEQTPAGRLRLTLPDRTVHDPVVAVRAFPISAPGEGVSIMSAEGHELFWIERLDALAPALQAIVQQALDEREFMPTIMRLLDVSGYVTPCTWRVETDRGPTQFVLKGEEDIRRIANGSLLISDSDGIHYLVRDSAALDRASRKILDRFL